MIPPGDLDDHLLTEHAVSMIRYTNAAESVVLTAMVFGAPRDAITIEAKTAAECKERLHARLEGPRAETSEGKYR